MKLLLSIICALSALLGHAADAAGEKPPEFIREIVAIKVPKIEAKDTTIHELISFIASRIRELDPHKPGGISILTSGFQNANGINNRPADVKDAEKKLDYIAKDIRVDKVFTDLARLFQVEFHVTSVGIVVTPSGAKPFPNAKAVTGDIYYTYKSKGEQAAP